MGLAATQARFLELTGRRSDIEYESQRINFELTQLAEKGAEASKLFEDKTSNKKVMFSFNDGTGSKSVDLSYKNYKSFVNQQDTDLNTSQAKMYLMSSSGNKIVVANEQDMLDMIANFEEDPAVSKQFTAQDFIINPDIEDTDLFQESLRDGSLCFATLTNNDEEEDVFTVSSLDTAGNGAFTEVYDTSDDKEAEAEYKSTEDRLNVYEKKLQYRLDQLDTTRQTIQSEIESVQKVIEDNIEESYSVMG